MWIDKLRSLSCLEYWMVTSAVFMLPVVNLALYLAGYQRTHRLLRFLSPGEITPTSPAVDIDGRIQSTKRCVRIAARRGLHRATCLRESLVVWWFLQWRRIDAKLIIGVDKSNEDFLAHAWVVVDGVPVTNQGEDVDKYIPMPVSPHRGSE